MSASEAMRRSLWKWFDAPPYLTDLEVADMCAGLTQPAAMIRYLRSLGLRVDKKPNTRK